MPHEEMQRLKQEIQSEYLAAFQKTVAMHEVFLIRLALHPTMRDDTNLQMFLEFSGNVRSVPDPTLVHASAPLSGCSGCRRLSFDIG